MGVYGDGYTMCGRLNVSMNYALIYQIGGSFPYPPKLWGFGVVGRCLVPEDRRVFPKAISSVARQYAPPQLPPGSHALMRSVSQRFCGGISLTRCEAHTIVSVVSSRMLLAVPFHSCLLPFFHIVPVMYAVDLPLDHSLWCALKHTFLVHLIAEFSEQGHTNTLYFHGFRHVWFEDRLPI